MATGTLSRVLAIDVRYGLPLLSVLVFGITLLVYRDLTDPVRRYLVPSLAIYSIGAGMISYMHIVLARRQGGVQQSKGQNQTPLHKGWFTAAYICHLVWFVCFVIYNFWRDVL